MGVRPRRVLAVLAVVLAGCVEAPSETAAPNVTLLQPPSTAPASAIVARPTTTSLASSSVTTAISSPPTTGEAAEDWIPFESVRSRFR